MWVDYRSSLSTVYNDGEISICGQTLVLSRPNCNVIKLDELVKSLDLLSEQ